MLHDCNGWKIPLRYTYDSADALWIPVPRRAVAIRRARPSDGRHLSQPSKPRGHSENDTNRFPFYQLKKKKVNHDRWLDRTCTCWVVRAPRCPRGGVTCPGARSHPKEAHLYVRITMAHRVDSGGVSANRAGVKWEEEGLGCWTTCGPH